MTGMRREDFDLELFSGHMENMCIMANADWEENLCGLSKDCNKNNCPFFHGTWNCSSEKIVELPLKILAREYLDLFSLTIEGDNYVRDED